MRPFSEIETAVARTVLTEAAKALHDSLSPIAAVTLDFERMETRLDFAAIEKRTNPALVARLGLGALGRGGDLLLVMPQSALDSIREALAESGAQKQAAPDAGWSQQMQTEIRNTGVRLQAVVEEQRLSLAAVASLRVGQLLPLAAGPTSRIRLECNGRPLFWCEMGQADGAYTLRVDAVVEKGPRHRQ